MSNIIYISSTIIYTINVIYFIKKIFNYKSDERGSVIMRKASSVVYAVISIMMCAFLFIYVSGNFDVEKQVFSLENIRSAAMGIMATLSTINSISIMYYEKKM